MNLMHNIGKGGGVITHTLKLAKAIRVLGHNSIFVTLPTTVQDPTATMLIDERFTNYAKADAETVMPLALYHLGRTGYRIGKDVIPTVIQSFDSILTGPLAISLGRLLDIPVVLRVGANNTAHLRFRFLHSKDGSMKSEMLGSIKVALLPIISTVERYTVNSVNKVVANCDYLRRIYSERVFDKERVTVIRNGIDIDFFTPKGPTYELNPNSEWIVYVGRIEKRKGIEILLHAFSKVRKSKRNVNLLIVGRALSEKYLDRVKTLVRSLNLENAVKFGGAVPNHLIPNIMRASRMIVFPSTTNGDEVEGLPNTVLEGMSCGVPVIANRCVWRSRGDS
jgi:glycosyltransferase involved in cell wall biosynthesis